VTDEQYCERLWGIERYCERQAILCPKTCSLTWWDHAEQLYTALSETLDADYYGEQRPGVERLRQIALDEPHVMEWLVCHLADFDKFWGDWGDRIDALSLRVRSLKAWTEEDIAQAVHAFRRRQKREQDRLQRVLDDLTADAAESGAYG